MHIAHPSCYVNVGASGYEINTPFATVFKPTTHWAFPQYIYYLTWVWINLMFCSGFFADWRRVCQSVVNASWRLQVRATAWTPGRTAAWPPPCCRLLSRRPSRSPPWAVPPPPLRPPSPPDPDTATDSRKRKRSPSLSSFLETAWPGAWP